VVAADLDGGAQPLVGVTGRHPHVHHGDVGVVLGDGGKQRLAVPDGGDHVVPPVGEDLRQARPDHGGVLGDDDSHRRAPFPTSSVPSVRRATAVRS
jgi:hypothetical protein